MHRIYWTAPVLGHLKTNFVIEGSNTLTILTRGEFEEALNKDNRGWTIAKSGVYLARCSGRTKLFLLNLLWVFLD